MDNPDLLSQSQIDKFRRTRKPKDIVRTKSLLEREPIEPKVKVTLLDIGERIQREQDKAEKVFEEKLKTIRQEGLKLARQYRTAKDIKKEEKIMKPSDIIGIGKTGGKEDKKEIKNKHIHYAKKYGIPFEVDGVRRTYEDLLRAIKAYEEANIYNIIRSGYDKKTEEYGMYIQ